MSQSIMPSNKSYLVSLSMFFIVLLRAEKRFTTENPMSGLRNTYDDYNYAMFGLIPAVLTCIHQMRILKPKIGFDAFLSPQ